MSKKAKIICVGILGIFWLVIISMDLSSGDVAIPEVQRLRERTWAERVGSFQYKGHDYLGMASQRGRTFIHDPDCVVNERKNKRTSTQRIPGPHPCVGGLLG